MKDCPGCSFANPDGSFFCAKCGSQLDAHREDPNSTETYLTPLPMLAVGSTFADRYQIIEELGRGGMGRVYKVLDNEIHEKVALKILRPEISADRRIIERFRNELKYARKLRHKNVCHVYDLMKEKGTYFITMEYVSGEDLKSTINRIGRLSEGVPAPPRVTGLMTVDALLAGQLATFWDALKHLVLPALALAMGAMAQEARITRSTMADNLNKDYIGNARAMGVPERQVMGRFLLKASLIPTISIFALDFAATFSNAFLVEIIFNWPGISRYGVNAMLRKDLNAISGVILILGVIFISMNIIVDVVVGILDPRIRLSAARSE